MKKTIKFDGAYRDNSRRGQIEAMMLPLETEIKQTEQEIEKE